MKEFENKFDGQAYVKFSIPDDPSMDMIRGLLGYDSKRIQLETDPRDLPQLAVMWEAAKVLIQDWECDLIPDLHEDFLGINPTNVESGKKKKKSLLQTDKASLVVKIITYVGFQVSIFRQELDKVSKN